MADKKKDKKKGGMDSGDGLDKGNMILSIVLGLTLIGILLGGFAAYVKLDIGGFGSNVMTPVFKNVPVLKSILPQKTDTTVKEEVYDYANMDEAVAKIKDLQSQIDKLKKENDDITNEATDLKKENKKLKVLETQQEEFQALKKQFDEEVVYGDNALDVSEYAKYYESMNPDTAKTIYQQVVTAQQTDAKVQEIADTYAKMSNQAAATALEGMGSDMTMVCDILNAMPMKSRAAILDVMTSTFATKVTTKLYELANANS